MQCYCLNILFEKEHCEKKTKNLPIWNLSLNVEFKATYTTKLDFVPCRRKKAKLYNVLKNN